MLSCWKTNTSNSRTIITILIYINTDICSSRGSYVPASTLQLPIVPSTNYSLCFCDQGFAGKYCQNGKINIFIRLVGCWFLSTKTLLNSSYFTFIITLIDWFTVIPMIIISNCPIEYQRRTFKHYCIAFFLFLLLVWLPIWLLGRYIYQHPQFEQQNPMYQSNNQGKVPYRALNNT